MDELIDKLLEKVEALPDDDDDLREIYLEIVNILQIQRRSINKLMRQVMGGRDKYRGGRKRFER